MACDPFELGETQPDEDMWDCIDPGDFFELEIMEILIELELEEIDAIDEP